MSAEAELHDAICNAVILLNNGEEIAPEVSAILRTALANYNPAPPAVNARELQQCPNCLNDGCHCATCNPYPGELQQALAPGDAEAVPCHLCDGGVKRSHTGSVWCEACNRTGYRTAPPVVDARELQQAQPADVWESYKTWPADIRAKLSCHDLRRMSGWAAKSPIADWRIDTSAGGPILVYQNCSVIESEQAQYVLNLIAQDQQAELQQAQVVGKKPSAAWQQAYKEIAATPLSEIKGDLYQAVKKRSEEIEAATPQSSARGYRVGWECFKCKSIFYPPEIKTPCPKCGNYSGTLIRTPQSSAPAVGEAMAKDLLNEWLIALKTTMTNKYWSAYQVAAMQKALTAVLGKGETPCKPD